MPTPGMFNPNQPMSDRQYELMLSLSDLGPQEDKIKQQMALANEVRGTAMPGMRGNSRIMVKANPLEFANTALSRGYGYQQLAQGQNDLGGLAAEIRRRTMKQPGPTNMMASTGLTDESQIWGG
jgi:hypothetical protein